MNYSVLNITGCKVFLEMRQYTVGFCNNHLDAMVDSGLSGCSCCTLLKQKGLNLVIVLLMLV